MNLINNCKSKLKYKKLKLKKIWKQIKIFNCGIKVEYRKMKQKIWSVHLPLHKMLKWFLFSISLLRSIIFLIFTFILISSILPSIFTQTFNMTSKCFIWNYYTRALNIFWIKSDPQFNELINYSYVKHARKHFQINRIQFKKVV